MALVDKQYDHGVYKRLLDFCTRRVPWSRQLWRLSSVLEIRELLEAAQARHEGVLSDSSVKYLSDGLVRRVKRDDGFGSSKQRGVLIGNISRKLEPAGHDAYALAMLAEQSEGVYLERWATAVRAEQPGAEIVSRAIGSFLLDAGFSQQFLHGWWTYNGRYAPGSAGIADLVEEAAKLARRPAVCFTVLVPLVARPPLPENSGETSTPNWLDATATSEWLAQWVPSAKPPRQAGALTLDIEARDSRAAVDKAATIVARLAARFRVGTRSKLRFGQDIFVIGEDEAARLSSTPCWSCSSHWI